MRLDPLGVESSSNIGLVGSNQFWGVFLGHMLNGAIILLKVVTCPLPSCLPIQPTEFTGAARWETTTLMRSLRFLFIPRRLTFSTELPT